MPFTDRSGDRLRDWMGVTPQEFYDEARVAIVPMGFCFPGQDAKGADLPPRRECATLWHGSSSPMLPQLELVLAVGSYAQSWHLGEEAGADAAATRCSDWRKHLRGKATPARAAAAASVLAQQWLAQAESLVRGGAVAGAAPRGAEAPAKN